MLPGYRALDLTHALHEKAPSWTGSCGFSYEIKMDYDQVVRVMQYKTHAGIGTHMDAPSHFVKGGRNIGDIALEELIVPCYVIDVSSKMHPDLMISPEEIHKFEEKHGKIRKGSLVAGFTGWSRYWNDPHKYRNPDSAGKMHFPGFSAPSAKLLLEIGIAGIGIDTLSPDGSDMTYPVHHLLLKADKYIIENLANLDKLPAEGAYALFLPLKVQEGAEAGIRAVGLIPL